MRRVVRMQNAIIILLLIALMSSGLFGIPQTQTPARAAQSTQCTACSHTQCHCGCACADTSTSYPDTDTLATNAPMPAHANSLSAAGCTCQCSTPSNEPMTAVLTGPQGKRVKHARASQAATLAVMFVLHTPAAGPVPLLANKLFFASFLSPPDASRAPPVLARA